MKKIESGLFIVFQVFILSVIWFAADYLVTTLHLPIPANVTGMLLLLLMVFLKIIKAQWLRRGATWLLADMLLFFVPAVVAVVNYQPLMKQEGLKILAVLILSTILVIAVTSLVVDRMYRLELKLARRKTNRHVHMMQGKRV